MSGGNEEYFLNILSNNYLTFTFFSWKYKRFNIIFCFLFQVFDRRSFFFGSFVHGAEDQLINETITTAEEEKIWGGINRLLMWSLVVYIKCLFCETPNSQFFRGVNKKKHWVNGNKNRYTFSMWNWYREI